MGSEKGSGDGDADGRWRDVLFEMVRRAQGDDEFRTRVEASGVTIDHFEAVLERVRILRQAPPGAIACRDEWWGFQLAIPHAMLAGWQEGSTEPAHVATAIGAIGGPASAFVRRVSQYIVTRLGELQQLDRGDGIHVSMTWMAPNIFVPTVR